jgi:hypothetical protein
MKKSVLLLFCLLFVRVIEAQDLNLVGVNPSYTQVGKLSNRFSYNLNIASVVDAFDVSIGAKTFPKGQLHLVPQGVLAYKVNNYINVGAGFGYGIHNIFGTREYEPRWLAQTTIQHKIAPLIFSHRLRYELRQPYNEQTKVSSKADIVRYQLGATLPLYNPKTSKKGFYVTASNELFLYVNGATNGPVSSKNGGLLSEDWANLSLGYTNGRTRFEAGYCFQTLVRNAAKDIRQLNFFHVGVIHTINWDDLQVWYYLP